MKLVSKIFHPHSSSSSNNHNNNNNGSSSSSNKHKDHNVRIPVGDFETADLEQHQLEGAPPSPTTTPGKPLKRQSSFSGTKGLKKIVNKTMNMSLNMSMTLLSPLTGNNSSGGGRKKKRRQSLNMDGRDEVLQQQPAPRKSLAVARSPTAAFVKVSSKLPLKEPSMMHVKEPSNMQLAPMESLKDVLLSSAESNANANSTTQGNKVLMQDHSHLTTQQSSKRRTYADKDPSEPTNLSRRLSASMAEAVQQVAVPIEDDDDEAGLGYKKPPQKLAPNSKDPRLNRQQRRGTGSHSERQQQQHPNQQSPKTLRTKKSRRRLSVGCDGRDSHRLMTGPHHHDFIETNNSSIPPLSVEELLLSPTKLVIQSEQYGLVETTMTHEQLQDKNVTKVVRRMPNGNLIISPKGSSRNSGKTASPSTSPSHPNKKKATTSHAKLPLGLPLGMDHSTNKNQEAGIGYDTNPMVSPRKASRSYRRRLSGSGSGRCLHLNGMAAAAVASEEIDSIDLVANNNNTAATPTAEKKKKAQRRRKSGSHANATTSGLSPTRRRRNQSDNRHPSKREDENHVATAAVPVPRRSQRRKSGSHLVEAAPAAVSETTATTAAPRKSTRTKRRMSTSHIKEATTGITTETGVVAVATPTAITRGKSRERKAPKKATSTGHAHAPTNATSVKKTRRRISKDRAAAAAANRSPRRQRTSVAPATAVVSPTETSAAVDLPPASPSAKPKTIKTPITPMSNKVKRRLLFACDGTDFHKDLPCVSPKSAKQSLKLNISPSATLAVAAAMAAIPKASLGNQTVPSHISDQTPTTSIHTAEKQARQQQPVSTPPPPTATKRHSKSHSPISSFNKLEGEEKKLPGRSNSSAGLFKETFVVANKTSPVGPRRQVVSLVGSVPSFPVLAMEDAPIELDYLQAPDHTASSYSASSSPMWEKPWRDSPRKSRQPRSQSMNHTLSINNLSGHVSTVTPLNFHESMTESQESSPTSVILPKDSIPVTHKSSNKKVLSATVLQTPRKHANVLKKDQPVNATRNQNLNQSFDSIQWDPNFSPKPRRAGRRPQRRMTLTCDGRDPLDEYTDASVEMSSLAKSIPEGKKPGSKTTHCASGGSLRSKTDVFHESIAVSMATTDIVCIEEDSVVLESPAKGKTTIGMHFSEADLGSTAKKALSDACDSVVLSKALKNHHKQVRSVPAQARFSRRRSLGDGGIHARLGAFMEDANEDSSPRTPHRSQSFESQLTNSVAPPSNFKDACDSVVMAHSLRELSFSQKQQTAVDNLLSDACDSVVMAHAVKKDKVQRRLSGNLLNGSAMRRARHRNYTSSSNHNAEVHIGVAKTNALKSSRIPLKSNGSAAGKARRRNSTSSVNPNLGRTLADKSPRLPPKSNSFDTQLSSLASLPKVPLFELPFGKLAEAKQPETDAATDEGDKLTNGLRASPRSILRRHSLIPSSTGVSDRITAYTGSPKKLSRMEPPLVPSNGTDHSRRTQGSSNKSGSASTRSRGKFSSCDSVELLQDRIEQKQERRRSRGGGSKRNWGDSMDLSNLRTSKPTSNLHKSMPTMGTTRGTLATGHSFSDFRRAQVSDPSMSDSSRWVSHQ